MIDGYKIVDAGEFLKLKEGLFKAARRLSGGKGRQTLFVHHWEQDNQADVVGYASHYDERGFEVAHFTAAGCDKRNFENKDVICLVETENCGYVGRHRPGLCPFRSYRLSYE